MEKSLVKSHRNGEHWEKGMYSFLEPFATILFKYLASFGETYPNYWAIIIIVTLSNPSLSRTLSCQLCCHEIHKSYVRGLEVLYGFEIDMKTDIVFY